MIHGFWPMSDLPFDLKFVPADLPNQWFEVSERRREMMPLYNRYVVRDPSVRWGEMDQSKMDDLAWEAVIGTVWQCGSLINKHILGSPYIHPAGNDGAPNQPWSEKQGGLRSAVVINLSAGGKTA